MATLCEKTIKAEASAYALEGKEYETIEHMMKLLKPCKTATEILCSEKDFTISQMLPCLAKLRKGLASLETDSVTMKSMKKYVFCQQLNINI